MNKIILLVGFIFFTSLPAQSDAIDPRSHNLSTYAYGGLGPRCFKYGRYDGMLSIFRCLRSVYYLPTALGIKKFEPKAIAAFQDQLIDLFQSKSTLEHLENLIRAIDSHEEEQRDFYLWDWAFKEFKGSEARALEFLAVILQDTSEMKHLEFLEANGMGGFYFRQIFDDLSRLIKHSKHLKPYPRTVKGEAPRSIYHYYVNKYLTRKLCASRSVGCGTSVFLMDVIYHYVAGDMIDLTRIWDIGNRKSETGFSAILNFLYYLPGDLAAILRDPDPAKMAKMQKGHRMRVRAMYVAFIAISDELGIPRSLTSDEFLQAFIENPALTVRILTNDLARR